MQATQYYRSTITFTNTALVKLVFWKNTLFCNKNHTYYFIAVQANDGIPFIVRLVHP